MLSPHSVRAGSPVVVLVALGAAAAVVVWEPWHGPTLLSLSAAHGIASGDLLALPLLALAAALGLRGRAARRVGRVGWAGPASAIVLGALLVGVGIVGVIDRGPMMPSGGGTIGGTVRYTAAPEPNPVGEWTHLAVTFDGARLRLFVNGRQVATNAASGRVRSTTDPLWIGGDEPFGEFFEGEIDEVRIYDRAEGADEIRADMATPVAAADPASGPGGPSVAAGLVLAYGFAEGAGESVADASGHGNAGTVLGAAWTAEGRYGSALRFDGVSDRVRIAPSTALDLRGALTLSAWVRPATWQRDWRVIVYRQTDIYFLTASSNVEAFGGAADDLLATAVVVAGGVLVVTTVTGGGRWLGPRRRSWAAGVALLLVGLAVDAALAPHTSSATLVGPAFVLAWFAVTARRPAEAVAGGLAAAAFAAATVASLAGRLDLGALVQSDGGGVARATALGAAALLFGVARLRAEPSSREA